MSIKFLAVTFTLLMSGCTNTSSTFSQNRILLNEMKRAEQQVRLASADVNTAKDKYISAKEKLEKNKAQYKLAKNAFEASYKSTFAL